MGSLVRLAILLIVLTFKAVYYFFLLIFMAFRALWKSNLDPRIKWGATGGVALLVVVSAIFSSNQPSTQVASTTSSDSSAQVQAAANTPTVTSSRTPTPTPTPTAVPTPKPVPVVVAPKATAPP
ncbi:MAG: hypothetical protein M3Z28_13650, partial [Candidatus Dormibacteraeota bacterium]|nr:hypothetical protein [Candidatus Dormibacteraeota bacterium]